MVWKRDSRKSLDDRMLKMGEDERGEGRDCSAKYGIRVWKLWFGRNREENGPGHVQVIWSMFGGLITGQPPETVAGDCPMIKPPNVDRPLVNGIYWTSLYLKFTHFILFL